MQKYHKIHGLYRRFLQGPFRNQFQDGRDGSPPEFAKQEFAILRENMWRGTEKIDGTNIRIFWDAESKQLSYGGRTDKAQIPDFLDVQINKILGTLEDSLSYEFSDTSITLYGEGYGAKIQKGGGHYIPDGVDFILFDIQIGKWWLERSDVDEIAELIGLRSVPTIFEGSLIEAEEYVKQGFDSVVAEGRCLAEGLVLTPIGDFLDRSGNRIITKIKTKDYK